MKVKVGLIGPRRSQDGYGIGQFIARELLNYPLSDLTAIMGTTSSTLAQAVTDLNSNRDRSNKFKGSSYTIKQSREFFNNPKIDLIVICSPSETHEEYIRKALMDGKHVLVEKPLLHDPGIPFEERIQKAHSLVKLADGKGLFLATNCQRVSIIQVLCENLGLPLKPFSVDIELETSSRGKKVKSPKGLFELLITHPLSLLVKYGLTDFKSMKIENCSQKSNLNSSDLTIDGSYDSPIHSIRYRIKVKQTKKSSFARTVIELNDENPVEITTEESPDGKLQTRYIFPDKNSSATYSEDHLKTSITKDRKSVV